MVNSDKETKHFKVVWGKVLGIPVGTATPITDEGQRIFVKHFVPIFVLIGTSIFGTKLTDDRGLTFIVFMLSWFGSVFIGFLLWRQIKKTAIFEREYFLKKTDKTNQNKSETNDKPPH